MTEVAASLQLQLPEFESSCIFGVCTSAGSHFCIRLTRRDNLASDHQPLEHGAHARPSERTRATPANCCPAAPASSARIPTARLSITASSPEFSSSSPSLSSLFCAGSAHRLSLGRVLTGCGTTGSSWSAESDSLREGSRELPGLCAHWQLVWLQ